MPITLTPSSPSGDDLISTDRAAENATLLALSVSNPDLLASLISAASRSIERYCKRSFTLQSFTEIYSGGGMPYMQIQLANFPVTEITRIATAPQAVLSVTNTSTSNQRATASTTSTGLRLRRVASAVTTTNDLAFTSYVTLSQLATAITALANGWTATVVSGFGSHPSADLLPRQGAASALSAGGGVQFEMYIEDSPAWGAGVRFESPYGLVGNGPGWRLDADSGILVGAWPQGNLNIRIDYSAGFDPIPVDVQEACVQHVQDLYQAGLINNNVKSATLGPFSYTTMDRTPGFSAKVKSLLAPYIDHAKSLIRRGPDA